MTDATPSSFGLRPRPPDYSADPYLLLGGVLGVGAAGFGLSASRGAAALVRPAEQSPRVQKRVRFDRRAALILGILAAAALAIGLARLLF